MKLFCSLFLELTPDVLKEFKTKFESNPKNLLASSACVKIDFLDICLRRKVIENTSHTFTHKVSKYKF